MKRRPPTVEVAMRAASAVRGPVVVADVETPSGWSLRITRDGDSFHASLTGPNFGDGMDLRHWTSLAKVIESVDGYLGNRGLSHVASALRASVDAEVRG